MVDLNEIKERTDLVLNELEGGLFGGDIRVVQISDDEILFNAKDCALLLEYKRTERAIKQHVADEFKVKLRPSNFLTPQNGGLENTPKFPNRGAIFLTEQGLYQLINGSKMAKAQEFQKWVTEVLVTFRKTGKYDTADFAKSKYKKTIKQLPGYHEDNQFKRDCIVAAKEISKSKGMLVGAVWNKIVRIFYERFNINILREISKFTKRNKLDKAPNTREYLDIAGYRAQTYVAFEILSRDEAIKTNPERLAYSIAMCKTYYDELNDKERTEVREMLVEMMDKGILKPDGFYAAVKEYCVSPSGVQTLIFND